MARSETVDHGHHEFKSHHHHHHCLLQLLAERVNIHLPLSVYSVYQLPRITAHRYIRSLTRGLQQPACTLTKSSNKTASSEP